MPSQMEGKDWQTWPAHIYAKSKRASDWLYFVNDESDSNKDSDADSNHEVEDLALVEWLK